MRKVLYVSWLILLSGSLSAQTQNAQNRNASKRVFEGQPASIRLAPHVTTTIRLPEAVNSVVLGDSNRFQAEYSPKEPLLVFARPTASDIAETNLVISTVFGRQFILILRSLSCVNGEAWRKRQTRTFPPRTALLAIGSPISVITLRTGWMHFGEG